MIDWLVLLYLKPYRLYVATYIEVDVIALCKNSPVPKVEYHIS